MFKIVKREQFSPVTYLWQLEAPEIAKAARPGHFVIVRHGESGERVPLTIADFDRQAGTITLVIQAVGKTTHMLKELKEGELVQDVAGPLGHARQFDKVKKVVCIGGGLGVAPTFPQLRQYKQMGAHTISIVGFRSKDLMFWVDRFREQSDECIIATDDGSFGVKGLVTGPLQEILQKNQDIDEVLAIGPAIMMKACAAVTKPMGIKTVVSLNPIMVDGTGMCGGCRVTVNGKMAFACIDGPEFDGHAVDFDELMARAKRFDSAERESMRLFRDAHECRLRA